MLNQEAANRLHDSSTKPEFSAITGKWFLISMFVLFSLQSCDWLSGGHISSSSAVKAWLILWLSAAHLAWNFSRFFFKKRKNSAKMHWSCKQLCFWHSDFGLLSPELFTVFQQDDEWNLCLHVYKINKLLFPSIFVSSILNGLAPLPFCQWWLIINKAQFMSVTCPQICGRYRFWFIPCKKIKFHLGLRSRLSKWHCCITGFVEWWGQCKTSDSTD